MNLLPVILFLVTAAILYLFLFYRKEKNTTAVLPDTYRSILHRDVPFYRNLAPEKQADFENRMMRFLGKTRIIGVRTEITDTDKVYIAASAIMPVLVLAIGNTITWTRCWCIHLHLIMISANRVKGGISWVL